MPLTREEREEYLTEVAKRLIRDMLDNETPKAETTLEKIEQPALSVGNELQRAVAGYMVANIEQLVGASCPACGKEMVYQGQRRRVIVSEAGEITLQRAYYYCRSCKIGSFPPR